jgi:hypothetical protein
MPPDCIAITEDEYRGLILLQDQGMGISHGSDGKPEATDQSLIIDPVSERFWRNLELCRADIELYKVQDSDSKAKGSVSDWRNYRKMLRGWPESLDFPNKEFRPKAPDA